MDNSDSDVSDKKRNETAKRAKKSRKRSRSPSSDSYHKSRKVKKSKSSHKSSHKSNKRKKEKKKVDKESRLSSDSEISRSEEDPLCILSSIVEGQEHVSHDQIVNIVQDTLSYIIQEDPLLKAVPKNASFEDLEAQISFEEGRAMQISVCRADGEVLPIIVDQGAKVIDLKNAIRQYMTLKFERENIRVKINWTYVWRTYWLYFERQKLKDDYATLNHYGMYNSCQVTYVKRLREKQTEYKGRVQK